MSARAEASWRATYSNAKTNRKTSREGPEEAYDAELVN